MLRQATRLGSERMRKAEAWRDRARQLRATAAEFPDAAARADLEELAQQWERQADWMLRLSSPAIRRRRAG